ncbi:MAG: Na/Pi cotransporter family protein [Geminicoccaceae bacterium]|nr:MAG: Na/Pi cotransporter family protein [Geminicoccaceae bacterium]
MSVGATFLVLDLVAASSRVRRVPVPKPRDDATRASPPLDLGRRTCTHVVFGRSDGPRSNGMPAHAAVGRPPNIPGMGSQTMATGDAFFLAFTVLGGLGLFLFGMQVMTAGLRDAAGDRLRLVIYRGTRAPWAGLGLGTALGFSMHSSATTVMTVGFINAGLLGLAASIPLFMGANLGTTLSMQLISFKLTDYALAAVAVGALTALAAPSTLVRSVARSVLGFGLLFLGMDVMSGAIAPHREELTPWLAFADGTTWRGMVLGTLAAWLFTAVVQSSGATIGMTFVLISAGALTSLTQVYPIVLGAHLGTTTTALLACLGTNVEAKRGAVANLLFNVANVALGLLAAPLFIALVQLTSDDVVRQTANLHTALMLVAALVFLPFTAPIAGLLRRLVPSKGPVAPVSFLDPTVLDRPENALTAVIREHGRTLDILMSSFMAARGFAEDPKARRRPRLLVTNEQAVNEIRDATHAYLDRLTHRYLSRRQRLLAQYLSNITADLERVGDHLQHVVDGIESQRQRAAYADDAELQKALLALFDHARAVLAATRRSLDVDAAAFPDAATEIEAAHARFVAASQSIRQNVNDRVAEHDLSAIAGLFFGRQARAFEHLGRHCFIIAQEQQQPLFALKPAKFDRFEPPAAAKRRPRRKPKRRPSPERASPNVEKGE